MVILVVTQSEPHETKVRSGTIASKNILDTTTTTADVGDQFPNIFTSSSPPLKSTRRHQKLNFWID
jgi:hypothetical protein